MTMTTESITPEHREKARQFITLIGLASMAERVADHATNQYRAHFGVVSEDELPENFKKSITLVESALKKNCDKLRDQFVDIYAATYSEESLDALTTFYTSPAGRLATETGEVVQTKVVAAGNDWTNDVLKSLGSELIEVLG
jgi:hypothetical protein